MVLHLIIQHSQHMNCFTSHFYPGMWLFASVLLMAMPGFSSLPTFPKNLFSLLTNQSTPWEMFTPITIRNRKKCQFWVLRISVTIETVSPFIVFSNIILWLWYLYVLIVSSIRKIFMKCCSRQSVILRPHISYLSPQSQWDINQRRVMIVQENRMKVKR